MKSLKQDLEEARSGAAALSEPGAIRRARERTRMTQVQLAVRANISLTMLRTLEYGAIPKRSKALAKVAAAFKAWESEPGHGGTTGHEVRLLEGAELVPSDDVP